MRSEQCFRRFPAEISDLVIFNKTVSIYFILFRTICALYFAVFFIEHSHWDFMVFHAGHSPGKRSDLGLA